MEKGVEMEAIFLETRSRLANFMMSLSVQFWASTSRRGKAGFYGPGLRLVDLAFIVLYMDGGRKHENNQRRRQKRTHRSSGRVKVGKAFVGADEGRCGVEVALNSG